MCMNELIYYLFRTEKIAALDQKLTELKNLVNKNQQDQGSFVDDRLAKQVCVRTESVVPLSTWLRAKPLGLLLLMSCLNRGKFIANVNQIKAVLLGIVLFIISETLFLSLCNVQGVIIQTGVWLRRHTWISTPFLVTASLEFSSCHWVPKLPKMGTTLHSVSWFKVMLRDGITMSD